MPPMFPQYFLQIGSSLFSLAAIGLTLLPADRLPLIASVDLSVSPIATDLANPGPTFIRLDRSESNCQLSNQIALVCLPLE